MATVSQKRLIPERTVDSLFAAEVVRHDPYALIWSPSQYKDSFDHAYWGASTRLAIVECKAVTRMSKGGTPARPGWSAPVNMAQLNQYVTSFHLPVVYLLLGEPDDARKPHVRNCTDSFCRGGYCRACCRDARSWGLLADHIPNAPDFLRIQPWFCHWAWIVPATDLQQYLQSGGVSSRFTSISVANDALAQINNSVRLCHFLHELSLPHSPLADSMTSPANADSQLINQMSWPEAEFDELQNPPTLPLVCVFSPASTQT